MTWPFVTIQPSGWMMDPLPSSPIAPGVTAALAPEPQRTVAVAPIFTAIMTTAGLARKTADWSSASDAASARAANPAITSHATIPITSMLALRARRGAWT